MAKTEFSGTTQTTPRWAGDYLGREHQIPGGARLDAAQFAADATTGRRPVPSGTFIGRTLAERDAGTGFGPADTVGDEEMYLSVFDVVDANNNPDVELYRHNSVVKENFLPGWAGLTAAVKTAVRDLYTCTVGV